ncbi:ArgK protein [Kribbella amoyensis]|uniref:ArgK protein n=1 Tax=Kribbella amoyensis TaxID=996641 RepID=A0A561B7D0_9ACTN|nr:nucleoside/nucleotide kinase family protein [Kribbella amoyensis]TWD74851.1 ArgK protein [Kribbella amoyensis]
MRSLDRTAAFARAAELATLATSTRRAILGITGAPAAGKSTYAEELAAGLTTSGHRVALVPMDGYHLAQSALEELGIADVKGAPHTFDGAGYAALLRRLRDRTGETVWAPRFHRELEDSIAAAIGVGPEIDLVLTEGNYLLLDQEPWATARGSVDEIWYLELDDDTRHARLTARHQHFGRSAQEAHDRTFGSDERNAQLIAATKHLATATLSL